MKKLVILIVASMLAFCYYAHAVHEDCRATDLDGQIEVLTQERDALKLKVDEMLKQSTTRPAELEES